MEREKVMHIFPPLYSCNSKVLILGTIPSPKSRENGFYYSHPQNRFWKVMSALFKTEPPQSISQKSKLILYNKLALWDVLESCEICGADDSTICAVKPNDINLILKSADIKAVFTTGKKAFQLYERYCLETTGFRAFCLPSTSSANCAINLENLISQYKVILQYLEE